MGKRARKVPGDSSNPREIHTLFHLKDKVHPPLTVTVEVNKAKLCMVVDTGAAVYILSESTFQRLWPEGAKPLLRQSAVMLQTYSGEKLSIRGQAWSRLQRKAVLIETLSGPRKWSLSGRDWLAAFNIPQQELSVMHTVSATNLQSILNSHKELFKDELGLLRGVKTKLYVHDSCKPCFFKPRTVPYTIREKVEAELNRHEKAGVIEKGRFSEWEAPIVPVQKRDGSVRICGDYKLTINKAAKIDSYPLPRIEDILASIGNAKVLTKLDLANAYQQLDLDESKPFVTISTHLGLYRYNRLLFEVLSAPAIFQRTMETLLHNIPNVSVYLDYLLVSGTTDDENLLTLEKVFTRLQEAGLRLKLTKRSFMLSSVEYLGHIISSEGIRPTEEKTRAIVEAHMPLNVSQLKVFSRIVELLQQVFASSVQCASPVVCSAEKGQFLVLGKGAARGH